MKKVSILLAIILIVLFYLLKQTPGNNKPITNAYPWQIEKLGAGVTRVFGVVLNETILKEVDTIFGVSPTVALYESKGELTLEAYYKNVSLGGLIGSFIFTLDAQPEELENIKKKSTKLEYIKNNEMKYKLGFLTSAKAQDFRVKDLIYVPTVQWDEETIVKRFGKPTYKIKLKTKEVGWHYLYPEKGLDLIYKKEGKEILQYVPPQNFNVLLEPLQSH